MLTWNKAAIAGLGPAFTTILLTLDTRMGWGLGPEFWAAALMIAFGLLAFFIPNAEAPSSTPGMLKCVVILPLLLTLALLAGCGGDQSFQKQAYALGQSYAIAQRGAITYLEVAHPSQDVKDKINNADDRAAPMVKDVLECAKDMLNPPPPDTNATALGLDAADAQEAKCNGLLSEALLALDSLRNAVKEN